MFEPRWELKLGSTVSAKDGEYGHLSQLLLDPQQERVVALIVKPYGLLHDRSTIIPEEAIVEASDKEVRLVISRRQVEALPKCKAKTLLDVLGNKHEANADELNIHEPQMTIVGSQPGSSVPESIENDFSGSKRELPRMRVGDGQNVYCEDEQVGRLALHLLDSRGRLIGFVMHTNQLHGRNLIVPKALVGKVEKGNLYLSVDKSRLESLHEYVSDLSLTDEVEKALAFDEVLRDTDFKEIAVSVQDGIVSLAGHVSNYLNKKHAEDTARSVAGVVDVVNCLVIDEGLVIDVAQCLEKNELTHGEQIYVGAQNGVICLSGQVGSATIREAAEAIAASVPQVRWVKNYLEAPYFVVDPEEQFVHQPCIGQEVYSKDMLLGQVERVIINPHNRRVTAFIVVGNFPISMLVDDHGLPDNTRLYTPRRIVIPARTISYQSDSSVILNINSHEVGRSCRYGPTRFMHPPEDWQPPYPYRSAEVLFDRESR